MDREGIERLFDTPEVRDPSILPGACTVLHRRAGSDRYDPGMPANGTRTGEHLPNRHRTHRHHNRIGSIRITLTALATVLCATTAVTACGGSEQSSDSGTGPADIAAGEQVYADRCAACHGRDFQGSAQAPSHLDPYFAPDNTSDDDYRNAIRNGAETSEFDFGAMPALNLDDQQITDVIAYIRSIQEERGFNSPA